MVITLFSNYRYMQEISSLLDSKNPWWNQFPPDQRISRTYSTPPKIALKLTDWWISIYICSNLTAYFKKLVKRLLFSCHKKYLLSAKKFLFLMNSCHITLCVQYKSDVNQVKYITRCLFGTFTKLFICQVNLKEFFVIFIFNCIFFVRKLKMFAIIIKS